MILPKPDPDDKQPTADPGPVRCPHCGCPYSRVVWTRDGSRYADGKRRRKRKCGSPNCGKSFLGRVEQVEVEIVVGDHPCEITSTPFR